MPTGAPACSCGPGGLPEPDSVRRRPPVAGRVTWPGAYRRPATVQGPAPRRPSHRSSRGPEQPPSRRRPRWQPDSVRPAVRPVRRGVRAGHADRRPRGARRPLRAGGRDHRRGYRRRRRQAQPRHQPHPRGGARVLPGAGHPRVRRPAGVRHRARSGRSRRQQGRPRPGGVRRRRWCRLGVGCPDHGHRADAADPAAGRPGPPPVQKARALAGLRPRAFGVSVPSNAEPRTGLSMGEHMAQTSRRRSPTSPRMPTPGSAGTSYRSAGRACWAPERGHRPRRRRVAGHGGAVLRRPLAVERVRGLRAPLDTLGARPTPARTRTPRTAQELHRCLPRSP